MAINNLNEIIQNEIKIFLSENITSIVYHFCSFNNLLKIGIKIIAYNIEKIVCNILDTMYMFIFISDLYIILEVWASIDKPEKETKPQVIIIELIPSTEDNMFIPLVISIMPIKIPLLKGSKLFGNIDLPILSNIPDTLKISEITENKIINPPTKDIVSKLLFTLSPKICPMVLLLFILANFSFNNASLKEVLFDTIIGPDFL